MVFPGSFRDFVFRQHRWLLWPAVVVLILQFILVKIWYPHAIFEPDSLSYMHAAVEDLGVYIWPIGYSRFLRLVHFFSTGDLAVVGTQYVLVEISILYFYFTCLYFLRPGALVKVLILNFLALNPLIVCLSNYILSDGIFVALTVIWFTVTMWFLNRPKSIHVYIMVILLFLLFTIRYYAIFYPMITVPVILFSRLGWRVKLLGLVLGCVLFAGFVLYTQGRHRRLIGQPEFSPFSGWQLAANALIMYGHVTDRAADHPAPRFQALHQVVLHQLDLLYAAGPIEDRKLRTFYMWKDPSPLRIYMSQRFANDSSTSEFIKWASVGGLYKDYGGYLIKKHPLAFALYYVTQGVDWFIVSDTDFTSTFARGGYPVNKEIKDWFGYSSTRLSCTPKRIFPIRVFPMVVLLFNLLMVINTAGFFFLKHHRCASSTIVRSVTLAGCFWGLNFLFIIVSAPMVLRYAIPIMIFDIAFGFALTEYIYRADKIRMVSPTVT